MGRPVGARSRPSLSLCGAVVPPLFQSRGEIIRGAAPVRPGGCAAVVSIRRRETRV
jgi:hypothetical protein